MSFSNEIRDELCRVPRKRDCCQLAEAYGMLAFAYRFSAREIRLISEHEGFIRRAQGLLQSVFAVSPEVVSGDRWRLELTDPAAIRRVYDALGYDAERQVMMHFHGWIVEEDCCMASFLRGAFLGAGVCADPAKGYHLELSSSHGPFVRELLLRVSELSFAPRLSRRGQEYLLYLKESEHIEDFLTFIGAPRSAVRIMEEKVVKECRNRANRQNNCDISNIRRTVNAAEAQNRAIRALSDRGLLTNLPDALRETADKRLSFPDDSLSDLCGRFEPPLTKSCLNHRLRKLMALAKEENLIS